MVRNPQCSTMATPATDKIYLDIDYEDPYVQPLLIAALKSRLPPDLLVFLNAGTPPPPPDAKLLQWRQYECLDFEHLLAHPTTRLANSYVIRKALMRKHYLAATVTHWLAKHPTSPLRQHVPPAVELEVDYAEFLDEALVEAFELRESWARNEGRKAADREWWILKPGMSERGQGIRLFSSEEELRRIFEGWDPESEDEDEDEDAEDDDGEGAQHSGDDDDEDRDVPDRSSNVATPGPAPAAQQQQNDRTGVITSQLRHFIAQPYIHPPLLLPAPHPAAGRKFHLRPYVCAVGALQVYVYRPMLALFAAKPYTAPGTTTTTAAAGGPSGKDAPQAEDVNADLTAHLSNTCLQPGADAQRASSVHAFWDLPASLGPTSTSTPDHHPAGLPPTWRDAVFAQIQTLTAQTFEAAARTMGVHFQPVPNAFEVFGVDFLVDARGKAWLLEVNAFPDFGQTGEGLRGLVEGLVEGVVEVGVKPFFFGGAGAGAGAGAGGDAARDMVKCLDLDLGRR